MTGRYILDGKEPAEEPDIIAWATWFEKADRVVKQTPSGENWTCPYCGHTWTHRQYKCWDGTNGYGAVWPVLLEQDVKVSTVFLGLDHQFGDGPPLLFQTMVFGGEHDQDQWRYSTWDEAVAGHDAAVASLAEKR